MCKWTLLGCILLTSALAPVRGAGDYVELTMRGRLTMSDGTSPTTITIGEGPVARTFTLVFPEDAGMRETARNLNGKTAVVVGVWERKLATITGSAQPTPRTRVVVLNGVERTVVMSGRPVWVTQKKVVEFIKVKSISPVLEDNQKVMPKVGQ
jgi:hypothetical protein